MFRKFANKNVLVIGVAKSGYSAILALSQLGAHAFIFDSDYSKVVMLMKSRLSDSTVVPIKKVTKRFLAGLDLVVLSPGVPIKSKVVTLARKMGVNVIGELELGYKMINCPLYAITGTNGKTTVTCLLGEIFSKANYVTHTIGNVGIPITSVALEARKNDIGVVEVSSYQLETIEDFHAFGMGITNITSDHLDRHGTIENYIAAKFKIFKNATKTDFALLNADDEVVAGFAKDLGCRIYYFSLKKTVQGVCCRGDEVVFREGKKETVLFKQKDLRVVGTHNLANTMLAGGMAFLSGITPAVISAAVADFRGVEHRLEFVENIEGVDFYNDSKATNPDSVLVAVAAFQVPIVLIMGGSDKNSDFCEMFSELPKNVRKVVVCGATSKKIMAAAGKSGFKDIVEVAMLSDAVTFAKAEAHSGEVVLLSPGCASFDAFNNFEHRGEVFKALVRGVEE